MDGVLIIRKEKDIPLMMWLQNFGESSTEEIGHTGTLDPDAEGVLPVVLGRATKLVDLLTEKRKTYEALLHLGIETDTQDMTGEILSEKPVTVSGGGSDCRDPQLSGRAAADSAHVFGS